MTEIAVLGFGARGMMFSKIAKAENMKVVAVCDVNEQRLGLAVHDLGVDPKMCFSSAEEFFRAGKLADVLVLSTLDETHYEYSLKAFEVGYDVLLEKPIALNAKEVYSIVENAKRLKRKVGVCHVLRYTPFYMKIKEIIESGKIGRVMNINQTENVGFYHYAHSFVRGNWRRSEDTCPMILAKCCHDLDIILWLTGKHCKRLSSFGALDYFKAENAPEGAAKRCKDCKARENCPYDAYKIYTERPTWVKQPAGREYTAENAVKVLNDNSTFYDKCVFLSDNDVVDHQYVNLELEDGVLANLTMQGFSKEVYRRTQVCGTLGEINGVMEEGKITLSVFGGEEITYDVTVNDELSQHAGGDRKLFLDFVKHATAKDGDFSAEIDHAVESHKLAFAAEKSRLAGGSPIITED